MAPLMLTGQKQYSDCGVSWDLLQELVEHLERIWIRLHPALNPSSLGHLNDSAGQPGHPPNQRLAVADFTLYVPPCIEP